MVAAYTYPGTSEVLEKEEEEKRKGKKGKKENCK